MTNYKELFMDAVFILGTILFFATCAAMVLFLEKLGGMR